MTDYITRAELVEALEAVGRQFRSHSLDTLASHIARRLPPPVEPPKPQSLREKWLRVIGEFSRGSIERDAYIAVELRRMLDNLAPEGGPPTAWELKPGQCLAMDDDGDIVLSNLAAFDSGTILKRWPARKP